MSRTILLADDSVTIQKVIELTFMEEDYDVLAVSDGDEALEKLGEVTPDIVIADVHMPGASGLDVCRRSKEAHPDVPVLLLVGTFEPFDEAEADAAGADAHLKKPFDSQELLHLVGELMAPGARSGAGAGDELAPDLGELDLPDDGAAEDAATPDAATPEDTATEEPEEASAGGSDWGFGGPAGRDDESPGASASGADTLGTDFGDLTWGEGSQIEVEAPEAIGQQDEPAPVWGIVDRGLDEPDTAAGEEAGAAARDEDAGDEEAGDEEAGASEESDWGFQMARSLEADDSRSEEAEPEQAEPEDAMPEGAGLEPDPFVADAAAEEEDEPEEPAAHADEEEVEAPAFAASDDLESYGSADIEAAAYGGSVETVADPEPDGVGSVAGLSDDDVDRIARRVTELLGGQVAREVAWEVIPDLAEVVIRERLRELEGQLD